MFYTLDYVSFKKEDLAAAVLHKHCSSQSQWESVSLDVA